VTKDAIEDKLTTLGQVKARGKAQSLEVLGQLIGDRSSVVVAKAAHVAAEVGAGEFAARLVQAFDNFMKDGPRKDKRCQAKLAIVKALRRLNADDSEMLARGVRCVQMEPVYGGMEDTAAPLRVESAAALAETGWRGAGIELAQLLADPVTDARIGAARILAQSQLPAAESLLRLRVLAGEKEPAALQEYFVALLSLNPAGSVEFCSRFLDQPGGPGFEAAAMALGESRLEAAMAMLTEAVRKHGDTNYRQVLFAAISLLRRNDAMNFLLSTIAKDPEPVAVDAVEALAVYDRDETLVQRIRQTVSQRGSVKLRQAVEKSFGRA
jgi:hypothetical protein